MTVLDKTNRVLRYTCLLLCISFFSNAQNAKWKRYEADGDSAYNQQNFEKAIKMYSKAIDASELRGKETYRAVYNRALSYYKLERYEEALKDVDLFIPQYPQVSQAKLFRAIIYRELGDDDKQLVDLNAAMNDADPQPELLKWRGVLYLQKSEYAKAKSDLRLAQALQDDPEVETYLGLYYHETQNADSSYLCFNKSIDLDATFTASYMYAASSAIEDSNFTLALEYVNLLLRIEPLNAEGIFYKGIALIELNRVDEGCSCVNKAFYSGVDRAGGYLQEYCYPTEDH